MTTPILCQKHQVAVWLPVRHFCADLANPSGTPHPFVATQSLRSNTVYAWIELSYRTVEYPDLPQYQHAFLLLASVEVYATWSEEDKQAAYRRLSEQARNEFTQRSGQSNT